MTQEKVHVFAGNPLDRCGDRRRDTTWLAECLAHPQARFLPLWQLRALMQVRPAVDIAWQPREALGALLAADPMTVFLGLDPEGRPHWAVDASPAGEARQDAPLQDAGKYLDVRSAAAQCPGPSAAVLAQARSLIDWHARHGFCAVCGQRTEAREGGYSRQCRNADCRAMHFPRTDPVTIMLVLDGEHALLGRQARFARNSYSALAGFVEPGETIEEAVRREVMEEAGIRVGRVRYHSSQPWPFPSSLMIGCFGEAENREIRVDEDELEEVRWFHRDEVAAMVAAWRDENALRMPAPLAIAHQLARAWLAGE